VHAVESVGSIHKISRGLGRATDPRKLHQGMRGNS